MPGKLCIALYAAVVSIASTGEALAQPYPLEFKLPAASPQMSGEDAYKWAKSVYDLQHDNSTEMGDKKRLGRERAIYQKLPQYGVYCQDHAADCAAIAPKN
jgi:hypothetical protein